MVMQDCNGTGKLIGYWPTIPNVHYSKGKS